MHTRPLRFLKCSSQRCRCADWGADSGGGRGSDRQEPQVHETLVRRLKQRLSAISRERILRMSAGCRKMYEAIERSAAIRPWTAPFKVRPHLMRPVLFCAALWLETTNRTLVPTSNRTLVPTSSGPWPPAGAASSASRGWTPRRYTAPRGFPSPRTVNCIGIRIYIRM